jgi:hypothetical protein
MHRVASGNATWTLADVRPTCNRQPASFFGKSNPQNNQADFGLTAYSCVQPVTRTGGTTLSTVRLTCPHVHACCHHLVPQLWQHTSALQHTLLDLSGCCFQLCQYTTRFHTHKALNWCTQPCALQALSTEVLSALCVHLVLRMQLRLPGVVPNVIQTKQTGIHSCCESNKLSRSDALFVWVLLMLLP